MICVIFISYFNKLLFRNLNDPFLNEFHKELDVTESVSEMS